MQDAIFTISLHSLIMGEDRNCPYTKIRHRKICTGHPWKRGHYLKRRSKQRIPGQHGGRQRSAKISNGQNQRNCQTIRCFNFDCV